MTNKKDDDVNALENCYLDALENCYLDALEKKYKKIKKQLHSAQSSAGLYQNALENCYLDDDSQIFIHSNTHDEYRLTLIIIVIVCYCLVRLVSLVMGTLRTLTFRKIRKCFKRGIKGNMHKRAKNKLSTITKHTIGACKHWIRDHTYIDAFLRSKENMVRWIEVNTLHGIDYTQWIITYKAIEHSMWYNSMNIKLELYLEYGYHVLSTLFTFGTSYFDRCRILNDKYHEMEHKLFVMEEKYHTLMKENESMCSTRESMQQRINELSKDINDIYDQYDMDIGQRNEDVQRLQRDNDVLSNTLSNEYRKNIELQRMVNGQRDLREALRKKTNELRNIKGNNHYLMWNGDDTVDWMMLQQQGRYRCYEDVLREQFKIECITGAQFAQLSTNDLYRCGIKHFEDKKEMMGLIKAFVKKCKNKKDDPEELCDPITFELMNDPVIVVSSGRTYDKKTIKSIIKKGDKEPFSGHKITNKHLVPNKLVKELLVKYKKCKIIINP